MGDVRDAALVERATRRHRDLPLGGAGGGDHLGRDPRLDFEVNLGGTFNVLEAARKSGRAPFLLFTSTNKVYGDMRGTQIRSKAKRYEYRDRRGISESQPLDFHSPYGCSKGAADQYVRDYARIYDIADRSVPHVVHCRAAAVRQ